jgi:hypothetical protein
MYARRARSSLSRCAIASGAIEAARAAISAVHSVAYMIAYNNAMKFDCPFPST